MLGTGLSIAGGGAGNLVPVATASQLLAEETRQAELTQQQPVIQGLAAHVRNNFNTASQAKRKTTEERLRQCVRQRRGEYDADVMADIRTTGGTAIYMMLTANKCRSAAAWLKEVLFGNKGEAPWGIKPTSEPSLSPEDSQEVVQLATQEALQVESLVGMPITTPQQMASIVQRIADYKISVMREVAERKMKRMKDKMEDQLQEGGFYDALSSFIEDLVTFPFAVLKGPVVRKRRCLEWIQGQNGQYEPQLSDAIKLEWERVSPFNIYWAPYATDVDDGYILEVHELTRGDLEALIGVEGYDDKSIHAVLDEYGHGGLSDWLSISADQANQADAEGKSTVSTVSGTKDTITALQYWGCVQGKDLIDWGMKEEEVPDPLKEYECEVWVIGRWVIKATLNANPYGSKPYFKTSYEVIPGSWEGNGVADLVRDTQRMCNAAARALANNMGIASGPQVWVNVSRLAEGEKITQMYPWRIWQARSDPYGTSEKPVEFFQPDSNAGELMGIYEKFSNLADEYSGIPRYMTGDSPAGGAGRTASGMSMLMSNAGKTIKHVISNIDKDITQPLIERLYYYNMRYSDDPELKGDVKLVANGVNALVAQEQAQVRMNEILNIVASNPVFLNIVGEEAVADLLREVTEPLGMNIVPPKEVVRARIQQQQQMMALQQAAMAGGQGAGDGQRVMPGNRQMLMNKQPITDNFAPQRR